MDPLQCSCLENPRDRGAWWAAIYGVAQSRTQLKRLSSSSRSSSWSRGLWNFPGGASGKEPSCKFRSHRRHRWSLGWEDPLEKGNGNPFQYFYPENPHGQRSLVGSSPWGHKELDTTEWACMHACTGLWWCCRCFEQVWSLFYSFGVVSLLVHTRLSHDRKIF